MKTTDSVPALSGKNIVLAGLGHPLKGWDEQFDFARLNIQDVTGRGPVRIKGVLPEQLKVAVDSFEPTSTRVSDFTDVQAK